VSLAAIRQGLATNLSTIPETQVSAYIIMPTPPTIWVAAIQIQYDRAMGSRISGQKYTDEYTATIQAMSDFTEPQRGQEVLDQYMAGSGVYSVKAALETDRTLSGAADTIWVSEATGPTLSTFQTFSLLLAEWTVTIIATEVAL
jgi:hypothetical protein